MIRLLLKPISLLLNLLPRRAQLVLGHALGSLWFHVIRFRRNVVLDNLTLAFGAEKSESELRAIALNNFRHYGVTLVEIIASLTWSRHEFVRRVRIEGWEHLQQSMTDNTGGFLLTSHLGNWEFAICAVAARGLPLDVVVKQSRTPVAEAFLQWYRKRTGAGIFLEEGTAKDILRSLSRGRFIGFILDQFMGPPIGLPVRFFGKEAGTAAALALMSDKRTEPIIPVFSYRDSSGLWHTIFEAPVQFADLSANKEERLHQKTQMFNDILESHVRRHPDQWLWLHRRWKAYRGEPRWKMGNSMVGATLALAISLVTGCSAPRGETSTGIVIPPEPTISVPSFSAMETTMPPTPTPEPQSKKDKKSKKAQKETKVATPAPKPTEKFTLIPAHQIPFAVGERLEIDLNWMAIPAGTAVVEVKAGPDFNGRKTFHLWGNVLSSRLVDAIYHVDNTIESFVDTEALIPYKFLLHMVESAQNKETRVSFDHVAAKAFYFAKRVSQKWGPLDIDRQDTLEPNSKDMFSAFYFIRSLDFALHKKETVKVFENGQTLTIELLPVANELVVSKVGAFQCWKVAVSVNLNNALKPTGEMFLWFSDDLKHYPVRFEAKLKFGTLFGSLSSIRERL